MPAIAASGQVFILNGALTVSAGPNGYLATGSPVLFNATLAVGASGTFNGNFNPPPNAMGLLFIGRLDLASKFIGVTNTATGQQYLSQSVNSVSQIMAILPGGTVPTVTVTVVDHSGNAETIDTYWVFNVPQAGMVTPGGFGAFSLPPNYGNYEVITNTDLFSRLGTRGQYPQFANASFAGTGSNALVSAPGVGRHLVIWESQVHNFNVGGRSFVLISLGSLWLNINDKNTDSGVTHVVHGGLALPSNTGIGYTFASQGGNGDAWVAYTTEQD